MLPHERTRPRIRDERRRLLRETRVQPEPILLLADVPFALAVPDARRPRRSDGTRLWRLPRGCCRAPGRAAPHRRRPPSLRERGRARRRSSAAPCGSWRSSCRRTMRASSSFPRIASSRTGPIVASGADDEPRPRRARSLGSRTSRTSARRRSGTAAGGRAGPRRAGRARRRARRPARPRRDRLHAATGRSGRSGRQRRRRRRRVPPARPAGRRRVRGRRGGASACRRRARTSTPSPSRVFSSIR